MAALFRSTWWLWPLYTIPTVIAAITIDPGFAWLLIVFAGVFLYFAWVRYDDQGNRRELGS